MIRLTVEKTTAPVTASVVKSGFDGVPRTVNVSVGCAVKAILVVLPHRLATLRRELSALSSTPSVGAPAGAPAISRRLFFRFALFELQGPHLGVGGAFGEEVGVAAAFDDAALVEDDDLVGVHHRG